LVHNEIHYVPIGDGWEEVLVRNVLHYVPVLLLVCLNRLFWAQMAPLPMPLVMMLHPSKPLCTAP
jgi:hypothetical protein